MSEARWFEAERPNKKRQPLWRGFLYCRFILLLKGGPIRRCRFIDSPVDTATFCAAELLAVQLARRWKANFIDVQLEIANSQLGNDCLPLNDGAADALDLARSGCTWLLL